MSAEPVGNSRDVAPSAREQGAMVEHHRDARRRALLLIAARPFDGAMTTLLLAFALLLPLVLTMLWQNVAALGESLPDARELSVFLVPDTRADAVQQSAIAIRALDNVSDVRIRTPAEGLARIAATPGVSEALDGLGANPLPTVLSVAIAPDAAADAIAALAVGIERVSAVERVVYTLALRERYSAVLELLALIAIVGSTLLAIAALAVVGHAIVVALAAERARIEIQTVLGADGAYIRRPFLYLGAAYGTVGAALALLLTAGVDALLAPAVARIAESYASGFTLRGPGVIALAAVLVAGPMLGWLGAFFASNREARRARIR